MAEGILRAVRRLARTPHAACDLHAPGTDPRPSRVQTRKDRRAFTLGLAVRTGKRLLATIRVAWPQRPPRHVVQRLRDYLGAAAPTLAAALDQERTARKLDTYESLLERFPDLGVLTLSESGVVLEVRGEARDLFDVPEQRLVGRPLQQSDRRTPGLQINARRLRQHLQAARRDGSVGFESRLRVGDRKLVVHVTLVHPGPRPRTLFGLVRDLTEVKAIESALLKRNQELSEAAERLREIDVLKNEFMSNISHELRTPLTAIIAYSEALLIGDPDPQTLRDFLKVISDHGQKLQRLISGLLDISKLDSLATELKLQQADLNAVIRAAITTVRPTADKKSIGIEVELDEHLPPVWLDELRSQQIVWNLLTNAVKFSPEGSTIRVRSWRDGDMVWSSVQDEGIGIAPEHQKLVFRKFVQVDGSSTRKQGGVGLGLDLVKHLVELHGGRIHLESQVGKGTTFFFSIPVEKRGKPRLEGRIQHLMQGRPRRGSPGIA